MVDRLTAVVPGDTGREVEALARYLRAYGYLPPEGAAFETPAAGTFDESLEDAVASYQRLHRLGPTGRLDGDTIRMMNTPRCGVADAVSGVELAAGLDPGSAWGPRSRPIGYAVDLLNDVPAFGSLVFQNHVGQACDAWALAGGLTILPREIPTDLFVAFRRGDHGDGHPSLVFDGRPGGTLGHGFPPRHLRLAGHAHLDADENWSTDAAVSGTADLLTLLLHEIGHALGLEHDTQDPTAVMHERFEVGGARRSIGASDIQALLALYP